MDERIMRESPARSFSNPHEEALHSFCKQMLKSRLFRGFYKERRYVDAVSGYRDIVVLHHSEKDLSVILQDIRTRLVKFYQGRPNPAWIGITNTQLVQGSCEDLCIWVEFDELAFDQYWFSVKGIRFKENEIIIKLKPVRSVEMEDSKSVKNFYGMENGMLQEKATETSINLQDFQNLVIDWGTSIKRTIYEFMSNDISKENIKSVLKFCSLIVISLLSASVQAVKFIGVFTIHFMIESRRLLVVTTPIIMRVIDLCSKMIGGFYILLAMIWRDATGGGKRTNLQPKAITYDRPVYQSLEYKHKLSQNSNKL